MADKTAFALFFGNRGFFPESLIAHARSEMTEVLKGLGHQTLMMDADATRYGAVEHPEEGRRYAQWLTSHRGQYGGVILCLPNFGDETGAIAALQDCGVPILIQAYPDELDKMDMSTRRDSFCGKFSIMDVFYQYGLSFTALEPHTVHPRSTQFAQNIEQFDSICRVVNGMRRFVVGAIGARTTAFKTVRFDELALQRLGITCETLDLSEVISRVRALDTESPRFSEKKEFLATYSCWTGVPDTTFFNMVKLAVVLDEIISEYAMDALALRCWLELEKELGIAPCVLLSALNERGIAAACELDVCNSVMMRALHLASGMPAACLDWNNNYGQADDKCILFHCGPVPQSLMCGCGQIVDHPMFAKALGAGHGFGCNTGRILPSPMTFASSKTEGGKLVCYLGEGNFTHDPIPHDFFGCAGVAEIAGLQGKLRRIGYQGFRHHVSVTQKHVAAAVEEAFTQYLGYEITPIN
jgi:L-fucose isomerase-like protein